MEMMEDVGFIRRQLTTIPMVIMPFETKSTKCALCHQGGFASNIPYAGGDRYKKSTSQSERSGYLRIVRTVLKRLL